MTVRRIGEGSQPLICAPLIGKTCGNVLEELCGILKKKPDMIEWRADFFVDIASTTTVLELARKIKENAGPIPVIFTIRSVHEGGQPIALSDDEALKLNASICRDTSIEYVDYELRNSTAKIHRLRQVATEYSTKIILSYHNFDHTPEENDLWETFKTAESYGADVVKVAVMPKNPEDILTLLSVTLKAKRKLKVPVITMSMGGDGALTRVVGGVFGSAVTFAVGRNSSAPGQIAIEDMQSIMEVLQRASGNNR